MLQGTDCYSSYAEEPKPCYVTKERPIDDESDEENGTRPKDICYHLLKLFGKRSHRLESLLCPNTYTSNPLDYQLWLVSIFKVLAVPVCYWLALLFILDIQNLSVPTINGLFYSGRLPIHIFSKFVSEQIFVLKQRMWSLQLIALSVWVMLTIILFFKVRASDI